MAQLTLDDDTRLTNPNVCTRNLFVCPAFACPTAGRWGSVGKWQPMTICRSSWVTLGTALRCHPLPPSLLPLRNAGCRLRFRILPRLTAPAVTLLAQAGASRGRVNRKRVQAGHAPQLAARIMCTILHTPPWLILTTPPNPSPLPSAL